MLGDLRPKYCSKRKVSVTSGSFFSQPIVGNLGSNFFRLGTRLIQRLKYAFCLQQFKCISKEVSILFFHIFIFTGFTTYSEQFMKFHSKHGSGSLHKACCHTASRRDATTLKIDYMDSLHQKNAEYHYVLVWKQRATAGVPVKRARRKSTEKSKFPPI